MTNQTEKQPPIPYFPKAAGERTGGQELRIKEIVYVLLKRRNWLFLGAIIGLVFGLSFSVLSYVQSQAIKQYTVKTSIALTSQSYDGLFSKNSRDPDSVDFHLAEDMVDAAVYILKSDTMLNQIIEEVNLLGVAPRDIYNSMSMEQYRETQIVIINLYWENASEGVKILEAMNRLAPTLLVSTLQLGSVTVINNPTARFVIGGNLNLVRNVILGIIIGMLTGAALAVLDLILRPTLLTVTDVEKRLRIPPLGTISEHSGGTSVLTELLREEDGAATRSELADSFLALAYTLKRRLGAQEHPCVLLTSADRGEGRTVITACLAAALSRIGVHVLAVDFDFRNPMLAGLFFQHTDPVHSINSLYQGRVVAADAVVPVNGTLDILPSLLEENPLQLNNAAMDLVRLLREKYDVVLLDTPPVGQIADTMALNELTTQALFVMQYDAVTQVELKAALNRLESVEISVSGGVVNRVQRKAIADHRDRQSDSRFKGLFAKQANKIRSLRGKSRTKG